MNLENYFTPYSQTDLNNKKALITGASSGIGMATAIELAKKGVELFLVARRKERLEFIKGEILKHYPGSKINLVCGDLTHPTTFQKMEEMNAFAVDILINNAGIALGRETVQNSSTSDWEAMINLNILTTFKISKIVLTHLLQKGGGDLIHLSSIAAYESYPGGSLYCATKHALRAFVESMRKEVFGKNIRVMLISPGMVETEFSLVRFKGDSERAKEIYQGMTPLTPRDIAMSILHHLESPTHVVHCETIMFPVDQGSVLHVQRK